MRLPGNRRNTSPPEQPSRRRGRNTTRAESRRNRFDVRGEGRQRDRGAARSSPRGSQAARVTDLERRKIRLAVTIFAMLIVAIFAIVAVGWYREFYQPPRVTAGEVRGTKFTMGDLVKRIRVLQGINRYQGGFVDLSRVPFEILQSMLNAEVLRQASPGLGISITEENVNEALRNQFYPQAEPGQQTNPGQLDQEFQSKYQAFLTATGLSDKDYRVIMEESLAQSQLRAILGATIQDPLEQVEVEWIHLDLGSNLVPADVRKRLDTENFADVAAEVNVGDGFASEVGYVGWVPKGAFPQLDEVLYGEEARASAPEATPGAPGATPPGTKPPLAVGAISEPVFTQEGTYIIRKTKGPEVQPVSGLMRIKLNSELVLKWQNEQLQQGSEEGWLKMNFDSNLYAWVADQVKVTAPRTRDTGGNGGPG